MDHNTVACCTVTLLYASILFSDAMNTTLNKTVFRLKHSEGFLIKACRVCAVVLIIVIRVLQCVCVRTCSDSLQKRFVALKEF